LLFFPFFSLAAKDNDKPRGSSSSYCVFFIRCR
jgi:hypothetical protein